MLRVMIVEDEPLVRRGILSMLPFARFEMELAGEAETAEAALKLIEQTPIDLVFTDISMPGMGGIELLRVLKEKHSHIRSVVLTCHQDFDFLQQALRLGAIDYIVKTQLDDDSVLDLLKRIADQFAQAARDGKREGIAAADTTDHEAFAHRWCALKWFVDKSEYETIMGLSLHGFQTFGFKAILQRAQEQWIISCPSLEELQSLKPLLDSKESMPELKEWIETTRQKARTLLRNTMYSEEVVQSIITSVDMLNDHAGDKLTQTEICKAINMSISYFSKSFKEIVGIPFVAFVQDLNIRRAKALLESTNYPVYQISEQSGFHDEKYFGKIFRQKTGCSPSEYRLLFRGNA
ncbi:hypothetical protein Back11_56050 [Paenibacillus baekrokdamisoli]|uniref:Uncharacterized protein n=1 Tax=Paenibacillus baekrokdamisoli TaxID=1712516 RepID=A0A3G9IZD3_9BACL|nr:response regulator [Paenibacillus baekrokdamisoli]MBB3071757.1 two-component system response regulator YesN [Paenibacillus baekrokdamisoli]BBH24260.1 hypothetical protein Back11_56050 [Paenibacillus baekrokdamisoli]